MTKGAPLSVVHQRATRAVRVDANWQSMGRNHLSTRPTRATHEKHSGLRSSWFQLGILAIQKLVILIKGVGHPAGLCKIQELGKCTILPTCRTIAIRAGKIGVENHFVHQINHTVQATERGSAGGRRTKLST